MRLSFLPCRNIRVFRKSITVRRIDQASLRTVTHASTASVQHSTRKSYSAESSKSPSKFAQAIQQENKSALESSSSASSSTPSAASALGLAPETSSETQSEMAPPRRGAKAGAAKPNIDRNGKPVTTEPKPSASYVAPSLTLFPSSSPPSGALFDVGHS